MPLDPEVAALLTLLRTMPVLSELSPLEARAIVTEMGRHAPPGPALASVIDAHAGAVPVRIYRPGDRPRAVIVFFHAGGWVLGDLATSDAFLRRFALQTECTIVSVGYRKAPEHRFPAAVEDAFTTSQWVASALPELAGGVVPMFVAGESAGGNLAAVTAILARDRGGPAFAGQLLMCPVTDASFDTASYLDNAEGYYLTRSLMQWFWHHYVPDPRRRVDFRASPLQTRDLSGLPPTLIQTAEYDPLRDEGEAYGKRLAAAGTMVVVQRRDGLIHGYTAMIEAVSSARAAVDDAARWIGERLL